MPPRPVQHSKSPTTDAGSQTLARGLTALEVIGRATNPITVTALSQQLMIHRSMGYRLVKTLEQFGFVERHATGGLILGAKLGTLARRVSKDLLAAATPELTAVAEQLEMTTFLVTYDGESVVTLCSAEPKNLETTLVKKPGSRHAVGQGAPGKVIQSLLKPKRFPPQPFEVSENEVIQGIASIAVPVRLASGPPAALAVVHFPSAVHAKKVAKVLADAAERIAMSTD